MKFDLKSQLKWGDTHRSQSWNTGANNGAAIDCLRYREAAFRVRAGVVGSSGTIDYKIQESDDGSTNWTDVTGALITQVTATDAVGDPISVDCTKRKRYLRAVLTIGTAASQAAAMFLLSSPIDSRDPSEDDVWVRV